MDMISPTVQQSIRGGDYLNIAHREFLFFPSTGPLKNILIFVTLKDIDARHVYHLEFV